MLTIAYLANQFPSALEPYVSDEIQELRRRGVRVIAGSVRSPTDEPIRPADLSSDPELLCLEPIRWQCLLRALVLLISQWKRISDLMARILLEGPEGPVPRLKALLHTWLGAYYAVRLKGRSVDHLHAHHGYFGSWIAMVAARLLEINYSLTLHGSDLLLHAAFLDTKLRHSWFCVTISEYNRRYILRHFPEIEPRAVVVSRLGVDPHTIALLPRTENDPLSPFRMLSVGRLHPVKNYAFLVLACARLRDLGIEFECTIAGEGPERKRLELLIRGNRLPEHVTLLGHVAQPQLDPLYRNADLFVLTSLSEGIPVVLMEAMARGTVVLAPAITGIPELITHGKSGFLYAPENLDDFVQKIVFLHAAMRSHRASALEDLNHIRSAAGLAVRENFSRQENLSRFAEAFLHRIAPHDWSPSHEDPVLQQI